MTTRKPTPRGNDSALSVPTGQGEAFPLTYWDLWFAVVAAKDCGGDLGPLVARLTDERNGLYSNRDSVYRKLCHLRDLQSRLDEAGLTLDAVLAAAGDSKSTELRRARQRVLHATERASEWSEAMRQTPRDRGMAQALRGAWPLFPVSPDPDAKRISSQFRRDFYGEAASSRVADQLELFLDQADQFLAGERYAEAQALLRAWLTVVIELMARVDDSFGSVADCFRRGFATYLKIPLEKTGIDESVFFADLLRLLIWEDYALTWRQTDGYFRGLSREQGDWCVGYLRQQIEELRAVDLEYQSEEALTLLGQVAAEQDRFELFEPLAREMGAREWERIIRLADRAVKKRKRPLACQVFEAALTAGPHLDFLRKKYEQLKQNKWNPDPRA